MSTDSSSVALRIAIVGSGPAGLYAAVDVLKRAPNASVELFDRLPVIGGLVRSGVSPDHGQRRLVSAVYEQLAMASGRFRFHGNIEIGRDLSHQDLLAHHHAVIYASGAAGDRRLGIAGEDLPGSHAATEFVGWYNGHPDFADRHFDLSGQRAVVIGNGNVALDVARMLLLSNAELRRTDIADHALAALAASRIREVVIVGRRGAAQAAFTAPELMELLDLEGIDLVVENGETETAAVSAKTPPTQALRQQLLAECARRGRQNHERRLVLRFLGSPIEVLGSARVEGVRIARNRLVTDADGLLRAVATDAVDTLSTGLLLRSVGYRAQPLAGLPFDAIAGVLPNRDGRVIDPANQQALSGTYVAGWLKRGPSGVIGSNKLCSQQTITALLDDAANARLPTPSSSSIDGLLAQRQLRSVDYHGWKTIDRFESKLGAAQGRPRIKLARMDELLAVAG